jgi:hypothetical protein
MLSQPKSAMAAPQRELETSIQVLKCQQFARTKAYRQSVSLNYATVAAYLLTRIMARIYMYCTVICGGEVKKSSKWF